MFLFIFVLTLDNLINLIAVLFAVISYYLTQRFENIKNRVVANREIYLNLELAAIDLFRFEADHIELIRPIVEAGSKLPSKGTAERLVASNYVCQILNLFEMAISFRKEKIMSSDVFETWVAWFSQVIWFPGFEEIWSELRDDYSLELEYVLNKGLSLKADLSEGKEFNTALKSVIAEMFRMGNKKQNNLNGNSKLLDSLVKSRNQSEMSLPNKQIEKIRK